MTRRVNVRIRDSFFPLLLLRGSRDQAVYSFFFAEAIAEEAVYAFELNEGLFTLLHPPSNTKPVSQEPTKAPLGNPTPSGTPPPAPTGEKKNEKNEKYSPLQLNTSSQGETEEKAYSLSTILAIIVAVGLAHFLLVVGGFTGAKGFAKLEALQEKVAALFGGA